MEKTEFNKTEHNSNRIEHMYYNSKIEQIRIEQQNETQKNTGENNEMTDKKSKRIELCTIDLTKIECSIL